MSAAVRPYRIEFNADHQDPGFAPAACSHSSNVLAEIAKLREEMRPAKTVSVDLVEAYRREIAQVMELKNELEGMKHAIDDTRREVASLHVGRPAQVGIDQLSGELGFVVQQTETAANTILSAAEKIETEMVSIVEHIVSETRAEQHVRVVMNEVSKLYEACNFQDLTGQRIGRIVDTFGFIEAQINRMLDIWGGLSAIDHFLAFEESRRKEQEEAIGDQALANGPQVAGADGHVDQSEIDALFD
jgi:chemotaxis protein CheZ